MLTFTDACSLAGISPSTFRGWIDRGQFLQSMPRVEKGWRQYSEFEVLVMAIMGKMVRFINDVALTKQNLDLLLTDHADFANLVVIVTINSAGEMEFASLSGDRRQGEPILDSIHLYVSVGKIIEEISERARFLKSGTASDVSSQMQ
jgi:hypothetical protein